MQYRGDFNKDPKTGTYSMTKWDYGGEREFTFKSLIGIKGVWYIYY